VGAVRGLVELLETERASVHSVSTSSQHVMSVSCRAKQHRPAAAAAAAAADHAEVMVAAAESEPRARWLAGCFLSCPVLSCPVVSGVGAWGGGVRGGSGGGGPTESQAGAAVEPERGRHHPAAAARGRARGRGPGEGAQLTARKNAPRAQLTEAPRARGVLRAGAGGSARRGGGARQCELHRGELHRVRPRRGGEESRRRRVRARRSLRRPCARSSTRSCWRRRGAPPSGGRCPAIATQFTRSTATTTRRRSPSCWGACTRRWRRWGCR
jgi:hypothetical protein